MPTVDELARDVIASIATDANALAAAKWIDNRYKEMMSRVRFRHLRQVGELSIPGVYDTGTVAATRGSTAITGTATQFETDIGAGDQEYYFLRAATAWYKVASVGGELAITLDSAFAEDDVTAAAYKLAKRFHPLAATARWTGAFVMPRLRKELASVSLDMLDIIAPGRTLAGNIPQYAAQVGVDSNGYLMYEIYPPPVESELIRYVYWTLPPTLTYSSSIPLVIDPYVLKEGVLIDLYRYEMSMAIRKGNIEQAAIWRNEQRTQETKWQRIITDAIRTSRGADDISLLLNMTPGSPHGRFGEQRTARDYIFDNWSR